MLKSQLKAFVDPNVGGWAKLRSALSLRTMQTRVVGIVQRRRQLVRRIEELRTEASLHEEALHHLEKVQQRMRRRVRAALGVPEQEPEEAGGQPRR